MKNLKNSLLLKQLYQLKQLGYNYTSSSIYKDDEANFTLPNNLDNLHKQASECHLCALSKSREKVVFGEGDKNANVMIIGDVPSSSDDSTGKVFTGRSGELLTKMLENVLQLSRKDVYITNLLKCKAIDSIMPSSSHVHTCYPYLLKEIELVKPSIIITLGELPYQYLTNDSSSLAQARESVHKKDDISVIPTYHPNYLLRNPSAKKEVFEDLKKAKAILDTM